MSFLQEVDSLRSKLGLSRARVPYVIGLALLVCLVVVFGGYQVWQAFAAPSLEVTHATQQDSGNDVNENPKDLSAGGDGSAADADVNGASASGDHSDSQQAHTVFVHVAGCVASPGIYVLPQNARVADAIDAAGGMAPDARAESVNLARVVVDGEQILVGSLDDPSTAQTQQGSISSGAALGQSAASAGNALSHKVNINTASAEELTTLDGVGPATAEKIIAYRTEQGPFKTIDDIKEVSGIGEKKFAALKDEITV